MGLMMFLYNDYKVIYIIVSGLFRTVYILIEPQYYMLDSAVVSVGPPALHNMHEQSSSVPPTFIYLQMTLLCMLVVLVLP